MEKTIKDKQFSITIATAVLVMIFIISSSITIATWKTKMQEEHIAFHLQIDTINRYIITVNDDIEELQKLANKRDIQIATINTKLANIEALLIDIKLDLKNY